MDVKALLWHADIKTTMNYTKYLPDYIVKMIKPNLQVGGNVPYEDA